MLDWGKIYGRLNPSAYKQHFRFISNKYENVKLGKVAFIDPITTFAKLRKDDFVSFFPMESVSDKNGVITKYDVKKVSDSKGYTRFIEGDLIWAKITPCMQNGKSAIVKNTINGYACGSTEYFVIRPKSINLLNKYIHFLLRDKRVLDSAQCFFGGSAGQQRVSKDFLINFDIPLPPIKVQQMVTQLIENAQQNKLQKERHCTEILNSINGLLLSELGIITPIEPDNILDNRIFNTDFSEILGNRLDPFYHKKYFSILRESVKNSNYKPIELKQLFSDSFVKGYLPKEHEKDGENHVVQINSIDTDGRINLNELLTAKNVFKPKQKLFENDILVVITGATIGKIGFWSMNVEGNYYLGGDIIKFQVKENDDPYFVFSFLRTLPAQIELKRHITGATNGHLAPHDVKNIMIPLPPYEKQKEISNNIKQMRLEAFRLMEEAEIEFEKAKQEVEKIILE